jgi:MtN3 and saliva related transmembrane protein
MSAAVELVGYAAATLTTGAFAPQVLRSWRRRSVRDLSAGTLAALALGNVLWLAYGLGTGSGPLAAANAITFLLVAALGAMKLREMAGDAGA